MLGQRLFQRWELTFLIVKKIANYFFYNILVLKYNRYMTAALIICILLFIIFYLVHLKEKDTHEKLQDTHHDSILNLAYQAEFGDAEIGNHLDRTALFVEMLAGELQRSSPYASQFTEPYIKDLVQSAPLHDVGKVGIPGAVLNKPGRLTNDEFELMKGHSELGARILRKTRAKQGGQAFLEIAEEIAVAHHERWDGHGYPKGLAGEEIPLSARLMALADVYDALRSELCYKQAYDHAESVKIIKNQKGRQFDPYVVEAFLSCEKEFERISMELADQPTTIPNQPKEASSSIDSSESTEVPDIKAEQKNVSLDSKYTMCQSN